MNDEPPPAPEGPPPPNRRRGAVAARRAGYMGGWLLLVAVVLAGVLGLAALALTERTLTLPSWVTERIETRINRDLVRGRADLDRIEVFIDRRGVPRLSLLDVALFDGDGSGVAQLNRVQAAFDPLALLEGRIAPRNLTLEGAQINLHRAVDGSFSLSFGQGAAAFPGVPALLDSVETLLAQPLFARMDRAAIRNLTVTLEDARAARVWQVVGGQLTLTQDSEAVELALLAEVFNGTDDLARVQVSARSLRGDGRAAITANITNVAAQDIASQAPALSFLKVLDAPISGALRAALNSDGALDELAGTLDIAAGALRPRPETEPLAFTSARTYFAYRPETRKITFSEISFESPELSAGITGHAYLRDLSEQGFPGALVAQLSLDDLRVAPLGLFAETLHFQQGAADVRLRLDPFTLDIGQVVLTEPGARDERRRYAARGVITANPEGWNVAVDLEAPEVPVERALALWPVPLAAKTRDWLGRNISTGTLFDVNGAFRKQPGVKGDLAASFAFRDATLKFLKDMPPITGGAGYASIIDRRFAITVEQGGVAAPQGGRVDLAGSVMVVPDTREKPALGDFTLKTDGSVTAMLSLLDLPPLRILKNSPRGPDMAEGRAQVTTALSFRFQKGLKPADISYEAEGVLSGVQSATLVPGRSLAADRLALRATPAAVVIDGAATLDAVPVQARWRMGLAPDERGRSRLQGQVALSGETVRRLGLGLPEGMVSGQGQADITVDLVSGAPPDLRLSSDLAGLGLSIGGLDWSKPRNATGRLDLRATLGETPVVDAISIDASGLKAEGRITLAPGGGLERAQFDRVQLNDWLDAPVSLGGRGKGAPPAITVSGGRLDFRRAGFGKGAGAQGGGAARGPVTIGLDRLIVTEGITLTDFTGKLAEGRTTSGSFTARVNGGTPIRGELAGGPQGVSLRLIAADAGGVMRDAGLVKNGYDGPMQIILNPTGARGTYDGTLNVGRLRIRGAPMIADLLGAISVVGLLEQLNGDGLVFEETQASFRLTPSQVILYQSSATGASLGISMDGVYDLASKRIDMQGVVSPIYLLNRVGSIFTRAGEGLFGFNFQLTGPAARPSVQVNPLSILTPGMFREIFRRPAPER
ncbi:DUF3971 domain-containing protein [Oceaniglobus trochenteri]|uniref:YhdP family protein n=1 Tax=Oceaniglobus trochenteri TaxID=2763260 RepID=UPI001CFF9865|nr:DUF3971 domain-containing protein [Oceaniglobus trochenteri]